MQHHKRTCLPQGWYSDFVKIPFRIASTNQCGLCFLLCNALAKVTSLSGTNEEETKERRKSQGERRTEATEAFYINNRYLQI